MEAAKAARSKLESAASVSSSPRDKNRSHPRSGWLAKAAIALKGSGAKRAAALAGTAPAGDGGGGSNHGSGGGSHNGGVDDKDGSGTRHPSSPPVGVPAAVAAAAANPTDLTAVVTSMGAADTSSTAAALRPVTPPPPVPLVAVVEEDSLVKAVAAAPPPSPSRRPRGRGRRRPESMFISAVSGRLQRRATTTIPRPEQGGRDRLGHHDGGGGGGSCRGLDGDDVVWDDEDGDLISPARMSLELPPRDWSREDRSRRVSPRPHDRMTRTPTTGSNQSTSSVDSGSMLWGTLGGVGEPGGGAAQRSSHRSKERQPNNFEHGHVSTSRPRSVETGRCSGGARGLSSGAERTALKPEGGSRLAVDLRPVGSGGCVSAPDDSSYSMQLPPLLTMDDGVDRPVKHPSASASYVSSLAVGGAEGELFGGVGYRRDDFRNLTLLEEKATIRSSFTSVDSTAPSLPPIGEVPCCDVE